MDSKYHIVTLLLHKDNHLSGDPQQTIHQEGLTKIFNLENKINQFKDDTLVILVPPILI
jgi:ABC-type cobalamin/Fe3+-siderophores transport system ATPase subunit